MGAELNVSVQHLEVRFNTALEEEMFLIFYLSAVISYYVFRVIIYLHIFTVDLHKVA